jgi:hypothetical protein
MKVRLFGAALALALAVAAAVPVSAQLQSGSITGRVHDESGAVLPGVTVTLTGPDATRTFTTTANGEFRFLSLPPATYRAAAEITGFTRVVREDIVVVVGRNVELDIALKLSAVEETITVSGESPIVDTRQMGTSTNFTQAELDRVPTSRDPWALMRTVPGVMVDRVNIAGNETGQQSNFQSKGTRSQDAVWTMDGVVITDMSAVGASPTYYNYDNFEEIQVSTGGQDIKQPTGGIGLNFVVKRGTNRLRGGARGYFTSEGLESCNVPGELASRATNPVTCATADHNDQISDWGFDAGGPILKDRAWFYGSFSKQDIRLIRGSGNTLDRTILDTYHVKGNWQLTRQNMFNVLWFLGEKKKYGRLPGDAGILFNAPTAIWNQGGNYNEGKPHGLLKFEDSHTFGSSLFVTGRYAYYNNGFGLVPSGGLDGDPAGQSLVTSSSYGSTRAALFFRPNHVVNGDGNYFLTAFGASHDVKFGMGWRRADASSTTIWPGSMIVALNNSATDNRARLYREGSGTDRAEYVHFYIGDTVSKGRTTIDVGLRYDRQTGKALPSATRSNAGFPDTVPGIEFGGYEAPFTCINVSPRAGLTYALDAARKTILRASFSRYAGQLPNGVVGYQNPSSSVGWAEYPWVDLNGDHLATPNEVTITGSPLAFGGGFNPASPTAVTSANILDPDLKAPKTTSVVLGVDRELMANLAVQVNYSYTRTTDFFSDPSGTNYTPWVGLTASDYLPGPIVTGTIPGGESYSVQTFIPSAAVVAANGNRRILTNHPGYRSYYHGLEFQVIKRMSNRWMARISGAWNDPKETYGDSPLGTTGNPTRNDQSPLINGGPYAYRTSGSGSGDGYVHARWQVNANGVYALPWDMEVAANVFGRQGYPVPAFRTTALGLDGSIRVLVSSELDSRRVDNLWNTDLRWAKTFQTPMVRAQVVLDLFNVFNANTDLVRVRNAAAVNYGALAQNLSPRILRVGAKLSF